MCCDPMSLEGLALVTRVAARRAGRRMSQEHSGDEQAQAGAVVEVAEVVGSQNILQGELARVPDRLDGALRLGG